MAASDSVVEANVAYRFRELSIREEADRWKSCSVEVFLECHDGGAVYVLMLDRISTSRRRVQRSDTSLSEDTCFSTAMQLCSRILAKSNPCVCPSVCETREL